MASFSSPGIGSGLDVHSMVAQLVAAERAPGDKRFDRMESQAQSQISAFGKINSALSGLQDTLAKFEAEGASPGRKVTVADDAGFGASADPTAAAGRYQVTVESLASTHKLHSAPVATDTQLGHGMLTITVGDGDAFDVTVAEGEGSLSDIRDAINEQAAGKGITATVVHGDDGDVLVLASTTTGSEGRLRIAPSGGDGGLSALATTFGDMTVADPGNDAVVVVDGITRTSSSNRIDDLIDGVTLDLTDAKPGEAFALELKSDPSTLKAALLGFVSAYNTALSALRTQSAAGNADTPGAALSGDAAPRGMTQSLRGLVGSHYGELSALGFETEVDGSLSLDGATFDKVVAEDPQAVQRLLGDEGVLRAPLADSLKSWLGDDRPAGEKGLIGDRTEALETRLDRLETQRESFDRRIERVEASYLRQFSALDVMVAQMSTTSNFLTQQLAQLPTYGSSQ